MLFQLANAGLLPAALNNLARHGAAPGFIVSASIIVPQIIVALLSPWAGTLAERIGRRPVLLAGFAAVPLRALLFATLPGAIPTVAMQALDGVSAAVLGLMLPLIAADVTKESGYLNFAIGSLGLASALGAMFSTTLAGLVAERFGDPAAFLCLAAAWCRRPRAACICHAGDPSGAQPGCRRKQRCRPDPLLRPPPRRCLMRARPSGA